MTLALSPLLTDKYDVQFVTYAYVYLCDFTDVLHRLDLRDPVAVYVQSSAHSSSHVSKVMI
jgi:hypothetical protein